MEIIIASHNKNKIQELKVLLEPLNITVKSLIDLNDHTEIIEDGHSFIENALIKSNYIAKKYNCIALADDSGLEVEVLNNAPGIYSARYSGQGDLGNNLKLLEELTNVTNRNANFISVISLTYPNGEYLTFTGEWYGTIAYEMQGKNGFGYDPLFIPDGFNTSVAQMDFSLKQKLSHRALASKKLFEYLNSTK